MEPVPETSRVQCFSDHDFLAGILGPDTRHHSAPYFRGYNVGHGHACTSDQPIQHIFGYCLHGRHRNGISKLPVSLGI